MTTKKDIRLTFSGKSKERFDEAKAKLEKEMGFPLKDTDFARRLVLRGIGEVGR